MLLRMMLTPMAVLQLQVMEGWRRRSDRTRWSGAAAHRRPSVQTDHSTSSPSPPSLPPSSPPHPPSMPPPIASSSHTPLAPGQIYSQPALTGAGTHSSTILITALDALKAHSAPQRFDDFAITNGLTALLHDERLKERFKAHPRVMWNERLELLSYKVRS